MLWLCGAGELLDSREDIREAMAAGESVEPASHGEIGHGDFRLAERLDERGRNLR